MPNWKGNLLADLLRDLKYGVRSMARAPAFSFLFAILALAFRECFVVERLNNFVLTSERDEQVGAALGADKQLEQLALGERRGHSRPALTEALDGVSSCNAATIVFRS